MGAWPLDVGHASAYGGSGDEAKLFHGVRDVSLKVCRGGWMKILEAVLIIILGSDECAITRPSRDMSCVHRETPSIYFPDHRLTQHIGSRLTPRWLSTCHRTPDEAHATFYIPSFEEYGTTS